MVVQYRMKESVCMDEQLQPSKEMSQVFFLIQCALGDTSIYLLLMEKDIIFSTFFTLINTEVGIDPPWADMVGILGAINF